ALGGQMDGAVSSQVKAAPREVAGVAEAGAMTEPAEPGPSTQLEGQFSRGIAIPTRRDAHASWALQDPIGEPGLVGLLAGKDGAVELWGQRRQTSHPPRLPERPQALPTIHNQLPPPPKFAPVTTTQAVSKVA